MKQENGETEGKPCTNLNKYEQLLKIVLSCLSN